jgi:uncharacterized membrane protein
MNRVLRHLLTTRWSLRRAFPAPALAAIEAAIRAGEQEHSGEIRFAVENSLDLRDLGSGRVARQRALHLFATLHVWDTAHNNGVLIYLLLADRDIEIVADHGFDGKVTPAEWESVCRCMEVELRAGHFETAALAGIRRASEIITRHFPRIPGDRNELPDEPVVIR